MRRFAITLATIAGLALGATDAHAGEESTAPAAARLAAARADVTRLENQAELMQHSVACYDAWQACLKGVPVSEYGDADRQFGFAYDERDGSSTSFRPALAVYGRRRPGHEDYLFLDFDRSGGCRSATTKPGGSADAASARVTIGNLERRVSRLKRTARRLLAASERFDNWESCISWVPVTEYGDPDGAFGYVFGNAFRPALAIDRSDWDDPDYMFLAFVGGDRPGGECQNEPGEGID
jgi:hypothetical protein